MPNSAELIYIFQQWINWMLMCAGAPIALPACRPFWEWVMYASAAIGGWLLLWVAWRVVKARWDYDAAIRAQMERERVAPPDVMEDHKFKEVGDLAEDVTDPHLAKTIREELERQKLARISGQKPL